MPVFFAVIGTPLYDFAAGCVLAANVYLMIRGGPVKIYAQIYLQAPAE